jgi:hypothetical protein
MKRVVLSNEMSDVRGRKERINAETAVDYVHINSRYREKSQLNPGNHGKTDEWALAHPLRRRSGFLERSQTSQEG